MNPEPASAPLSYVLPLKWSAQEEPQAADLTAYLRWLRHRAQVIVVDGSPEPMFRRHRAAWHQLCTHIRPDDDLRFRNGKVNGVTTGVRRARYERVVLADDDVRYDPSSLERVAELLSHADLVRPQNYFRPLPWHARWDTARCLLNRSIARDYPGTFGIRRSMFLAMGGYDGNVLFENLELLRTVRAAGGRVASPLGLYVARRPPSTRHFLGQRVRQAYDDFAQPWRLTLWLGVVPATLAALARGRFDLLVGGAVGVVALAERGRRRAGGQRVYPAVATSYAPLWVLERGLCSWLAVAQRLRYGGVRYGESRIAVAAHNSRQLRRRLRGSAGRRLAAAGSGEPDGLVAAVAERLRG